MEEKVAALIFRSTKYTCFDVLDYTKSLTPFHPCQQLTSLTTTTILPTIFLPQFQLATTPCLTTPLTTNLSPSSQTPPTIETPKSLHYLESNTILYLSAIVSALKFTLNSIFKSSQTLNNFPKPLSSTTLQDPNSFIWRGQTSLITSPLLFGKLIIWQCSYWSFVLRRLGKSDREGFSDGPLLAMMVLITVSVHE